MNGTGGEKTFLKKNFTILIIVLGISVVAILGFSIGLYIQKESNSEQGKEIALTTEHESSMKTIFLEQEPPIVIQTKNEAPKELLSKQFKLQLLKDTSGYKLNDFELVEQIGYGSFGIVYKAKNKRTNQFVALKAYKFDRDGERSNKRQFIKERRFLQLLKGVPYVCKLIWHTRITKKDALGMFGDGKLQGILILDYYPNGDLYDSAIKNGKWDIVLLRKWLVHMVVALQHIHSRGLLHRDVKPQNMLLSEAKDVYLCDFGVAKRFKTRTNNNHLPGTPIFLAPEVIGLYGFSRASDVFALGVTLYFFVAKDLANFEINTSEKAYSLRQEIKLEELSELQKHANSLPVSSKTPPELHDLYKKMTEADPNQRITIPQIMQHPFFKDINWKQFGALS